jgi:hypothetical protein
MASEGGFKIHLSLAHPNGAIQPERDVTAARRSIDAPPREEPLEAPNNEQSLEADSTTQISTLRPNPHAPGTVGGIWNVKIEAEGAGESMSAAVAETLLAGFRDAEARVSTSFQRNICRYSVVLTVHADGVLTAVLRGIAHFQAAAQAARLPAVTVVGIDAREPAPTEDFDS